MKYLILYIATAFVLSGCIGQKDEPVSGRFTFPETIISLHVPQGWMKTSIPGNRFPVLFGEIQYGIKPNIRLEEYSVATTDIDLYEEFARKIKEMYPDISTENEADCPFKVNALACTKIRTKRTNRDNIPVIHTNYVLSNAGVRFILSATCAEPASSSLAPLFDDAVKQIELESL